MRRHVRALFALTALGSLFAVSAGTARAAECPNEGIRDAQHATFLPDCRAYEVVSPADKDGYGILSEPSQAASGGSGVAYASFGAFAGAEGSGAVNMYVASRAADGWRTKSMAPAMDPFFFLNIPAYFAFTPDLSKLALTARTPPQQPGAGAAPEPAVNAYVRDVGSGAYRLLTTEAAPPDPFGFGGQATFVDASAGFEDVLLASTAQYVPEASAGLENVYVAEPGQPLRLVAADADPGAGVSTENAISSDGSRIFYTSPSTNSVTPKGQLYAEEEGSTVHVSAPQRPNQGPDPAGTKAAYFRGASDDGSVAFFTSEEKLTEDAGAAAGSPDLYRYDLDSGELTDLTVTAGGAGVFGVSGMSETGERVYLVAKAALAPGASAGEPNLYLWDPSAPSALAFIATLLPGEASSWLGPERGRTTVRTTPDGAYLAFQTAAPIPGSANEGHQEVYLYSAATGELECASCRPDGSAATGDSVLQRQQTNLAVTRAFISRNLSDDGGRVFFETAEALVEGDSNGRIDVYQFDPRTDAVALISSGSGEFDASFVNADAAGGNAFFTTRQQLSPWDRDRLTDLYSARAGGGFPAPPPPAPPCQGSECRDPVPAPGAVGVPGSSRLVGPGNASARRAPSCRSARRKARQTRSRAKALRRRAARSGGASRAASKAKRARRNAKRLTKKAKRCAASKRRAR